MSNDNLEINQNLLKIDNVLTALNYILEEVQTRKDQLMTHSSIREKLREMADEDSFQYYLANYICGSYGEKLYREVSFNVMERIDADIEAFINSRVNKALEKAGVNVADKI